MKMEAEQKIQVLLKASALIGVDERARGVNEVGVLFGAPIYRVSWESNATHGDSDHDGSHWTEPDRTGSFLFFKGERYDGVSDEAAEFCMQWHYPLEEGPRLEAEAKREKEARQEAEYLPQKNLRARVLDPKTLRDWLDLINLDNQVKEALGLFYATRQHGIMIPLALPSICPKEVQVPGGGWDKRAALSETIAEIYPLYVEKLWFQHKMACPFCEEPVEENKPCDSCRERLVDDSDAVKKFEAEMKNWWPDPQTGLDEYRKLVRKYFRLNQYQCGCGRWAETPLCPSCEEKFAQQRAGGQFASAIRQMIGRKVQVACADWPVQVWDVLISVEVEKDKDTESWDWQMRHKVNMKFESGTTVEFYCYNCRYEDGIIHTTDHRSAGRYTNVLEIKIFIKEEKE